MVELISVHVPKTAGTAFRYVLLEVYGSEKVLGDYPPDRIYQPDRPLPENIQVIHGHFDPIKYQGYFPDAKRIVWLRHPIFRLISEYFFAKTINDRKNVIHAQLLDKNLGILEFAAIPAMTNFLTKKIKGIDLVDYDFVGIQEFYLDDLIELKAIMGWREFQPSVQNSNRYPDYYQCLQKILSDRDLINKLACLNNQDMELYQEALELRAKRKNESSLIQSTLADWQRSQFMLERKQEELQQAQTELKQLKYWSQPPSDRMLVLESIIPQTKEVINFLSGFHIDSPQFPLQINSNSISISGWVIGKNSPASAIIISSNGQILNQTAINQARPDVARVYPIPGAETSGFEIVLVVAGMLPESELIMEAVLEDDNRIKIGVIKAKVSANV